jgi:hypothetical protein
MMLECLVHAARHLATTQHAADDRLVLGQVRALKYGNFVAPGSSLRIEVDLHKQLDEGQFEFKAQALLLDPQRQALDANDTPVAVSGRFLLRPVRL